MGRGPNFYEIDPCAASHKGGCLNNFGFFISPSFKSSKIGPIVAIKYVLKSLKKKKWRSINAHIYIVGCQGASQLGGSLLGISPGYKANKLKSH